MDDTSARVYERAIQAVSGIAGRAMRPSRQARQRQIAAWNVTCGSLPTKEGLRAVLADEVE